MSKKCLDCAKRQQIKGWRVAEYIQYEKDCLWQIRSPPRPLAGPVNVRCLYYMPTAAEAANGWTGRSPAGTIFWPTRWRGRGDTNERRPNHEKDSNLV